METLAAAWVGPGAARALAAGDEGVVEIALRGGGYVRLAGGRLLLAPVRAPAGPLSALVPGLAPLTPGERVRIDATKARVIPAVPAGPLRPGWRAALAAAMDEVPAPRDGIVLAALAGRDEGFPPAGEGDLWSIAGRGEGLTPAGDDVLAGYAAWRHAEGRPAVLAAGRCSPLGLAYLRCAERGELPEVAARVLRAVRAGDAALAARRARGLERWGATSGSAILWGMAAAAGGP